VEPAPDAGATVSTGAVACFGAKSGNLFKSMTNSQHLTFEANRHQDDNTNLPPNTHVAYCSKAKRLNKALLDGFLRHQQDSDVKRSHLFNGRYENIYLTSAQIPELADLLDEACDHAGRLLGADDLQAGCWFNYMPPGAVTTVHSHDDFDELLSGVYYVSVPRNSGNLIIHQGNKQHVITPQEGMFVFFAPDAVHEVSENLSTSDRLSIGINFGRRKTDDE